jgi:hypothetical protein
MSPAKRFFITGIPAAGKSYLAKKLAEHIGGEVFSVDNLREELGTDPQYQKWVNFFLDKDEKEYYTTTSEEEQWKNVVDQSEALWPAIREKILFYDSHGKPVIFESVNILPHLAKRDLPFPGAVLTGKSREDIFERIKEDPRWGETEELWNLEADSFFLVERPRYEAEARTYGYRVFETADEAFSALVPLLEN